MELYVEKKARVATIAAQISTVGEGRAVLGEAARLLSQGYDRLGDIPAGFTDESSARESARSLLDQANDYAQRIYNSIPPVNLDTSLDPTLKNQVAAALQSALRALSTVETVADETYWDFGASLSQVLSGVGSAAGSVTSPISSGILSLVWTAIKGAWPLLVVGGILIYVYGRAKSQ